MKTTMKYPKWWPKIEANWTSYKFFGLAFYKGHLRLGTCKVEFCDN